MTTTDVATRLVLFAGWVTEAAEIDDE